LFEHGPILAMSAPGFKAAVSAFWAVVGINDKIGITSTGNSFVLSSVEGLRLRQEGGSTELTTNGIRTPTHL
jgi:hypothetical protein